MTLNLLSKKNTSTRSQHKAIDEIETYLDSSCVSIEKIRTFVTIALKEIKAH